MKTNRRSIAILSDQTLFRQGISELLRAHGLRSLSEYATSRELLEAVRSQPPDVLLIDLDHEREDTMTLVRSLRRELFDTQIIVIGTAQRQGAAADGSADDEIETPKADSAALVAAAIASGARSQSAEVIRQHRLWKRITPRQRDVMRWLATGADNRSIARKLRVGERAVKAHVSTLLETFGVTNRTRLALIADRAGLQPPRTQAHA